MKSYKIVFILLSIVVAHTASYADESKKDLSSIVKPHKKNSIEKEKKKLKHKEKKLERKMKMNAIKAVL